MMDEYLPLSQFKAVYIVDLCHSLCEQVCLGQRCKASKGFDNASRLKRAVMISTTSTCGVKPPRQGCALQTQQREG